MTDNPPTNDTTSASDPRPSAAEIEAERARVARVLRERARKLARRTEEAEVENTGDLITFELDGGRFAIEADLVREVVSVREVTPLPTSPDFVLGITNVRGMIIAVLDLRRILGRGATTRPSRQLVVVETGGVEVGFDVGEAGVARIPQNRLSAPATTAASYQKALAPDGLEVLDVARIIADTRQTAASLASGGEQ
jgi:purine-binding chemotaxis protein CheW